MTTKILILGHQGLLGSELLRHLSPHWDVIGKDRDDFDIASEDACFRVISEVAPDVVINAAAYTDVDGAEKERELCFAVNADGVKNIALACRPQKIKIVHFSTDYVFDGLKATPYEEGDPPRPVNGYGQSKMAGEENLKQISDNYLLIRSAWLYGREGKNFVRTILEKARTSGKLEVVSDQIGAPTYAKDLAAAVRRLIEGNQSGLFHITNRGSCSWYEFTLRILSCAGITDVPVTPIRSSALQRRAVRPLNSVLSCRKFMETTGKAMRFWQLALDDYLSRERISGGSSGPCTA